MTVTCCCTSFHHRRKLQCCQAKLLTGRWLRKSVQFCLFRCQISDDICRLLFFFNNYRLKRCLYIKLKFIHKVERLNVKQRRSSETAHMSRLIWIYVLCKSLLLSPVAVKELIQLLTCLDIRFKIMSKRLLSVRFVRWARFNRSEIYLFIHRNFYLIAYTFFTLFWYFFSPMIF